MDTQICSRSGLGFKRLMRTALNFFLTAIKTPPPRDFSEIVSSRSLRKIWYFCKLQNSPSKMEGLSQVSTNAITSYSL